MGIFLDDKSIYFLYYLGVWGEIRRDLELALWDFGRGTDYAAGGTIELQCDMGNAWLMYGGDIDAEFNLCAFRVFSPTTVTFGSMSGMKKYIQRGDMNVYYLRDGWCEEGYDDGFVVDLLHFVFFLRGGGILLSRLNLVVAGAMIPCCMWDESDGTRRTMLYEVSSDFVLGYDDNRFVEWHGEVSGVILDFVLDFMRGSEDE